MSMHVFFSFFALLHLSFFVFFLLTHRYVLCTLSHFEAFWSARIPSDLQPHTFRSSLVFVIVVVVWLHAFFSRPFHSHDTMAVNHTEILYAYSRTPGDGMTRGMCAVCTCANRNVWAKNNRREYRDQNNHKKKKERKIEDEAAEEKNKSHA